MTPAAGLSTAIRAHRPARDGAELWHRMWGAGPAPGSVIRLAAEVCQEFEDQADDRPDDRLEEVRDDAALHEDTVALRVSRDGTMRRMPAQERDGQAMEPGGREAGCGVVAPRDSKGAMRIHRCFSRRPEPGKTRLKRPTRQEVWHGMQPAAAEGREWKIVATADGVRDNGTVRERVTPDIRLVDVGPANISRPRRMPLTGARAPGARRGSTHTRPSGPMIPRAWARGGQGDRCVAVFTGKKPRGPRNHHRHWVCPQQPPADA